MATAIATITTTDTRLIVNSIVVFFGTVLIGAVLVVWLTSKIGSDKDRK